MNGIDNVDFNQHAYLTMNKLQEVVTAVLKPVIDQQKQCNATQVKIDENVRRVNNANEYIKRDIEAIKRTFKQFTEINN